MTPASRKLTFFLLISGLIAVLLSSYPIVFFGKSYVSPGYGPQLLYDDWPLIPGYKSSDRESAGGDPGAMAWAFLPYSRVQHEAVFDHGEFPLWNRYNSAGLPLFGQGQSMMLDPLHWIVVAGEGNGWAWDVKFLLAKLLFLIGIGACIFSITRSRAISFVLMVSVAFIGFFYYRFNHPVYFNLTYVPWLLFSYLQLIRGLQGINVTGAGRWRLWPIFGIFATSLLLLFSGTPKGTSILFGALHFAGLIGVIAVSKGARGKAVNFGILLVLWIAIALASAPHWLIFLDTLSKVSTVYDNPHCGFNSRLWWFIDSLFLGPELLPWGGPTTNTFISACALMSLVVLPRLVRKPVFWMALLPLVGLLAFAYGVIPNHICQKIPLIGSIHKTFFVCFIAAIVFAVMLAGFGLQEFFADLKTGVGRIKWTVFVVFLFALFTYWAYPYYGSYDAALSAAGMLAAFGIGGAALLFLLGIWLYRPGTGFSVPSTVALGCLFVMPHIYHGLHLSSGWKDLDALIINPTPRADYLEPSPAIDSLGYLLPADSFQLSHDDGENDRNESKVICDDSAVSDVFESYVNKYPDLLAAYHKASGGRSKGDWGKSHYCSSGESEGRVYQGPDNKNTVVTIILERAKRTGGDDGEIEKYEEELKESIRNSTDSLEMHQHAVNFLHRVKARPWPEGPERFLGNGRGPMSGFYSFLKLESLNGPDALMHARYMEFLDLMGWTLPRCEHWLRTMQGGDFFRLEPLLDVLNVGHLLSFRRDIGTRHLVSEYISYSDSVEAPSENEGDGQSWSLSLQKVPSLGADRVSCAPQSKGLRPDGQVDNVFVLDIQSPGVNTNSVDVIDAVRLERKDQGQAVTICDASGSSELFESYVDKYPDLLAAYTSDLTGKSIADWGRTHYCKLGLNENRRILPPGVFHTGGPNYVLATSPKRGSPLLNGSDGAVQIPVSGSSQRLWIYTCADGFDKPDSQYRIRAAVKKAKVPPLVMNLDMKVWEREHPWPRAFFVDEIASYIDPDLAKYKYGEHAGCPETASYVDGDHDLAKFIRQADGLPLAAVESSKTVWPTSERTVVAATDYQLTSNSTSFRVEAPTSGIVVLTETHIPGDIHVTINGNLGEVMTVNHAFRGVEIKEPGSYDIKFFYRPRLWYTSWILFGLGLTLLIVILSSLRILYQRLIPVG
ncbi:MAG: hypothetical protein HOI43_18765 [Gammaproteobacteria bacterium]|nr:hypothetical protein [Gammaproteobacteria bacterium]